MNKDMWQPIETAPKDGTEILLYDKNVWRLYPSQEEIVTYSFHVGWWLFGVWVGHDSSGGEYGCDLTPTHWMPLPEAPE